jgi:glycerophosphoryl diester phosphodiesterase
MKTPKIIAHRGDAEHAPENTIASFESAIQKGADAIELDVHLSADNELVVHHDYYLERTTNGTGFIGGKSLSEIKKLDVGSWFNSKFEQERMPTLSEVFELGKGKIRFEIELKSPDIELASKVLATVDGFNLSSDVEITSWHTPLLTRVKTLRPDMRIGQFFEPLPDWMEVALGIDHVIGLMNLTELHVAHLYPDLISVDTTAKLHSAGIVSHASANEQLDKLEDCLRSGVDQVSTNHLDRALKIRSQLQS